MYSIIKYKQSGYPDMKNKILYIEDEPFLGKIVKETLESQNYEVILIADGAKVMSSFGNFTPDICILDVMLPHIDGFTLGNQIRNQYPNLPIIFVTAKVETDDLETGFKSGGNDYIRKPFSTRELIIRIENQLSQSESRVNQHSITKGPVELGNYTFIADKYELAYSGITKKLSLRESEVLTMLVKYKNQTINRKSLLIDIWGDDSYYNSRTLDVYIRKLRKYFADDNRIEIITLKGKGYHFVVP
jgi:two-component system, OmpR family, response regulator VicR